MESLDTQTLTRLAANIQATTIRQLQESEGRIPPISKSAAYAIYGGERVRQWEKAGTVRPIKKGVKGQTVYLHSELESSLMMSRISAESAGTRPDAIFYPIVGKLFNK